ncbi:LysR family transcriptional regulator [Asaia sp. W19]|uniref:LysR family transcriptional regulator n=1 Tax=unclassified Asaia TaxID=2685023 RepID=UPI000F8F202D|nr:LysR family transcriptional regulator [Asaia sp. W19]RUT24241.1 LysR family transcriptional regulator [Asaia sp. W19]RUT26281.1 LysR family transcriptional regulator [Asaia sp. W19]
MSGHSLINRLKLRHLRLILELEATNNLHRAAERMNLSQPSVSKLLQEVEHALNTRLFERSSQGVFPTPSGVLAARHARLMLNDIDRLQLDMNAMQEGTYGTVRVGSIVAALPDLVSPVFAEISRTQPGISLSLTIDTSDALLLGMESGRLDFVIGRPLGLHGPTRLTCLDLASEPLCVVTSCLNPINDPGGLSLKDVAGERWILQTAPSPMRRAIEAAFTTALLPLPVHPIEASSMFATIDLLLHSSMLAVIPCSVSRHYERAGMIRRLSVPMPDFLGAYSLISIPERPLTPAADLVFTALREAAISIPDRAVQSCV